MCASLLSSVPRISVEVLVWLRCMLSTFSAEDIRFWLFPQRTRSLPCWPESRCLSRGTVGAHPIPGHRTLTRSMLEHRVINPFRPVTDSDLPDADVVVATWWETAEWVARLSPSKGAKAQLIQQMESNFPYQPVDRVEATWRLPLQKIVVSQWLADLARDRFGDPTSVIVPNGIDLNLFCAPPGASSLAQPLGCFTLQKPS